ncbi:hypothetical protein AB0E27_31330 [Streptomyces sparsogenes]|uniref:hypothetical protein n=1 Tax=Streptomyces sparsogenes TaxID=67365 RepID=UPI003409943C
MNNEFETHEIETDAGKFYVRILAAERQTFSSFNRDTGESTPTEEIQGRVWLATDPEFKGDVDLGHVKIRGRKYTIEHLSTRLSKGRLHARRGVILHWSAERSYRGGYRNDRGTQVDYHLKAWDVLQEMEEAALDKFEQEHPEWQRESTLRLFERERNHHLNNKQRRERQVAEEAAKAAEWQKRIDELEAGA